MLIVGSSGSSGGLVGEHHPPCLHWVIDHAKSHHRAPEPELVAPW